jgi:RNA polymerase sigma factor (sigma-70 family)
MLEPHELPDLLRRAQNGDRGAVEQLLAGLRPHLERLTQRYVDPDRAGESSADLVQEATLRIWQRLEQFRGAHNDDETAAMFHEWVRQLVHHVGLDKQRERHAQRRLPPRKLMRLDGDGDGGGGGLDPAASSATPSANAGSAEQARLIRDALDRIPEAIVREIVRLCFFEGLSLRQITQRLNLSYDKVRERYHHGLRILERELGKLL